VERLLGNLEIKRFSTRDEQEVAGYAEVMETVFRVWSDIPVTAMLLPSPVSARTLPKPSAFHAPFESAAQLRARRPQARSG
jgi:hypothetical protein